MVSRAITTVSNGLSATDDVIFAPIREMEIRRRLLERFIGQELKEGRDYGKIPGVNKPFLWKPGAEKLCTLFRFAPQLKLVNAIEDWNNGMFHYHYQCTIFDLQRKEALVEVDGCANSKEKKFNRTYTVFPSEATEEEKAIGKLETRTNKKGREYKVYVVDDPNGAFNNVHNIMSMAQKRALVKAVAIAANASDYFSHPDEDVEEEVIQPDIDRKAVMAETEEQMLRAGWDANRGKTYLKANYQKNTRDSLTNAELVEFLEFLRKLPDAQQG